MKSQHVHVCVLLLFVKVFSCLIGTDKIIYIWFPQDVKMDAEISDVEVAAHSSWRTQNSFLCSSPLSSSGCKYITEKNLLVTQFFFLNFFPG